MAWKTRAGGAAMKILPVNTFWSEVIATVAMGTSCLFFSNLFFKNLFLNNLFFNQAFNLLEQPGPALTVSLSSACKRSEIAVRDFQVRSQLAGREVPANDGAMGGVGMPVGEP